MDTRCSISIVGRGHTASVRSAWSARARGFTLIELVTCIVIIGVLVAVAGPRFFTRQPFAERGYASELASALRAARQVAVASACEVRVTIDPVTGYQALQRAPLGNTCDPAGGWAIPVTLTNGVTLAGGPASGIVASPAVQIVFDAAGRVTGAAPPPLGVGTFTVRVDAGSGYVSLQ